MSRAQRNEKRIRVDKKAPIALFLEQAATYCDWNGPVQWKSEFWHVSLYQGSVHAIEVIPKPEQSGFLSLLS